MIYLITIPLAIVISLAWYLPGIKAQGNNQVLTNKDYFVIAFKYGFAYTCLLIIVTEIAFDAITKRMPLTGLPKDLFANFFRAALLEEFFKFRGFYHAKRKYALTRKIDFIMVAGLIGLMYGFVEKVVLGSIGAVVVGFICPMHIMWQFNQGGHYFEYEKAKAAGDEEKAKKEWRMAILVPYFFHALWDSGLDIGAHLIGTEGSTVSQIFGIVMIIVMVAGGIFYSVRTLKKVIKTAKEEPLPKNTEQ